MSDNGPDGSVSTDDSREDSSNQLETVELHNVTVTFSKKPAVRNVSFTAKRDRVTSLIGPSGSGKTTLLRAINRLHDFNKRAVVTGQILVHGTDAYQMPAPVLRSRVGMVFQRPNPFQTMSIYENVASGFMLNGVRGKAMIDEAVEESLRAAVLWDAVKDRLKQPATILSGGEQQRLCIARALAIKPEVLLMDEPTSSLDPIATQQIEDLIGDLKRLTTVIIVTHNMQQAARVSDDCAFLLMAEDRAGELIEFNTTEKIFHDPSDPRTLDYIAGKFG